jgi:serine/threonine-protein kinase HipA
LRKKIVLKVWIQQATVGAIDHNPRQPSDYDFSYQHAIQAGQEVSLTMPHSLESYAFSHELHPIFQMNLPEGRLRESLERDFRKRTQNFDELKLLQVVGGSQIGRLRFANDLAAMENIPLQSVAELIAYHGTEDLLRDLLDRFAGYSGVSGVQPKVLIKDADTSKPSADQDRVTVKGATHIVKGWDERDYPELAVNEFFCLQVAQQAGLDVPHVALSENNRFLIVQRFDLTAGGEYLGFEDFCVLNGFSTHEKYQGSYEKLSKRITQFVSPEHTGKALETFFRSLAVSCALKNGDAHLKNFGVLYEASNQTVTLAPAYDIVTTSPYQDHAMALTLGGSKRFPDAQKLREFAKLHCNLQPEKSAQILEQIADAVATITPKLKQHIKDFPSFTDVGKAMLKAWGAES